MFRPSDQNVELLEVKHSWALNVNDLENQTYDPRATKIKIEFSIHMF
jgi:hypothetical protein